jgi:hypothetical protein
MRSRLNDVRVKEKTFHCLGEQLQAIAGVAMSGRENDMLKWESLSPITGALWLACLLTAAI